MNIETDIFKRSSINYKKIIKYGFKQNNNHYIYEHHILDNEFKVIIDIEATGKVNGKVIDLATNEEYIGLKTPMTGNFVNKVREAYKAILYDIKNNCCEDKLFIYKQANRINKYIENKYNCHPEFLWEKSPGCAIYRNALNNKWFGIIMNIDKSKIDEGHEEIEIINVKLNSEKVQSLLKLKGYYKAYHMGKTEWITIILNDTLTDETIQSLIDESYNIINNSKHSLF